MTARGATALHGDDVLAAASSCSALLESALARDWTVPVPGLDFTVASVVAHAAEAALWYSVDLWGGPTDTAAFSVAVRPGADNASPLTSLGAAARVLAAAVEAAPGDLRGFHPFGSPDPSGFAAMACDELLVRGDDAARGLGLDFADEHHLAGATLARLFPWHPPDDDPWATLLWANGRRALVGRPFQHRWRWHCAPLGEWDGLAPRVG